MFVGSCYQRTPAVADVDTAVCMPCDTGDVRGAVLHPQPDTADFPAANPRVTG